MQQHDWGSPFVSFQATEDPSPKASAITSSSSSSPTMAAHVPHSSITGPVIQNPMSLQYATPPDQDPTPQEADALRAGAMYGLSLEERDQALADVHGVTSNVSLDNEFMANRLTQLDKAITDIRSNKSAYLRAKIQSPDYVTDRKFRLQFLMADSFQPLAAAERLVAYFESKLVLFGPDKLTKDLTLEDLEANDIKCLEHGIVQRLVGKDHAGRVVVSCWPTTNQDSTITINNKLKAFWYLVSTVTNEEQEQIQQSGFVSVIFAMGPRGSADRTALWKIMYMFRSLPTRVASIHYCYDDPDAKSLANLAIMALDPKSRARFRTHYGSHDDVVAELSTFGIGSNLLTVDPRSEESTMVIREWFATRRLKESARATSSTAAGSDVVSQIGHYDVLFGRGKGIQAHPGNKRLRDLVEANLDRYERASRLEKTLLAETIVRNIKDTSGRFLRLETRGGGWSEVNDEVARDKIAHAFRTQRKSVMQRDSPTVAMADRKPPPGGDGTGGNTV